MENTQVALDRRLSERFEVPQGVYALLKNGSSKLGQIKNISKGGLAFMYINSGEEIIGSKGVDIFLSGHGYYLKDMPCKKISDIHLDNKVSFSTFNVRQIGIQFGELNQTQSTQLDYFIQNHTTSAEA
jgi:hypothetical protein